VNSAIDEGYVRHRRYAPIEHSFRYPLFLVFLDLAELDVVFRNRWFWSVERPNLAWFRAADHLAPSTLTLDEQLRRTVADRTGRRPVGPIRLLTHLRYFGHCFNPVSFFYCYDGDDSRVETIVAEVNNTPWGERHLYVLTDDRNEAAPPRKRYRFPKAFHVSPFFDVNLHYDWRFNEPRRHLNVHMILSDDDRPVFDATLTTERRELDELNLTWLLLRQPALTMRIIARIHWQALRLWWKGAVFYRHPRKRGLVQP